MTAESPSAAPGVFAPTIVLVAGARPNYPKIAALYHALKERPVRLVLVDTGQHYDPALRDEMIRDLEIPDPDYNLEIGSDRHAWQTAKIMGEFDDVLVRERPAAVVVVGDVNSTVASALVTAKAWDTDGRRPLLAHVEAGLRSGDRTMPEEINRIITDTLADLLFTTEHGASANLYRENAHGDVYFVGNVMVDTLQRNLPKIRAHPLPAWAPPGGPFIVATLHRPATVDRSDTLTSVLQILKAVADGADMPVLLICHPRTQARINALPIECIPLNDKVQFAPAMPYLEFLALVSRASVVLTDSGGLQEETTVLGVPCLTLRPSTERPVTERHGTNRVVGLNPELILQGVAFALQAPHALTARGTPPLWDGHAADRIADILVEKLT